MYPPPVVVYDNLRQLRHDAIISLELLNADATSEDTFAETFLNDQRDPCTRFDTLIRCGVLHAHARPESESNVTMVAWICRALD